MTRNRKVKLRCPECRAVCERDVNVTAAGADPHFCGRKKTLYVCEINADHYFSTLVNEGYCPNCEVVQVFSALFEVTQICEGRLEPV